MALEDGDSLSRRAGYPLRRMDEVSKAGDLEFGRLWIRAGGDKPGLYVFFCDVQLETRVCVCKKAAEGSRDLPACTGDGFDGSRLDA